MRGSFVRCAGALSNVYELGIVWGALSNVWELYHKENVIGFLYNVWELCIVSGSFI